MSSSNEAKARAEAIFKRKEQQAREGAKAWAEYQAERRAEAEKTERQLFYEFCLDEVVPDDHLVRQISSLSWVHADAIANASRCAFAHLKRILRLDRLRLRGPRGAQDEFVLGAIAQNLRRLAKLGLLASNGGSQLCSGITAV
jgi:hypothetical protein